METGHARIKKGIAIHTGFSLGVLLLLFSGSYYFYNGKLTTTMISSYFFFLLCIYIGRWLCTVWLHQNKPVRFLFYTLCSILLILIAWFGFVRLALGFRYAGFLESSVYRGPLFTLGIFTGILIKF